MKERYRVTYNADLNEGKGKELNTKYSFSTYKEALDYVKSADYAKRFGIMGQAGRPFNIKKEKE